MSERKRINWLLILQGWAMLWVVIGHSPLGEPGGGPLWENVLYDFAYSFHMSLFMLVSGWLFYRTRLVTDNSRKWSYGAIIKDKAVRLLLPGLVFSLIALLLKIIFPGEISRKVGFDLSEIIHGYIYPYDNPLRELWFIVTLFWLFILTPLWRTVFSKSWSMWVTLGLLVILYFVGIDTELLCFDRVSRFAVWFYLGMLMSSTDVVEKVFEKHALLTFTGGIVIYVVGCLYLPFLATLGGIILSLGLALILDRYLPQTFFSFRNYTYQIFLMGIFAQMLVKILYRYIELPYILTYLVCIIAGLYVPVAVSKLLEKINSKPLLLCAGLKTKNK